MCQRFQPASARPLVAPIASGRFERKTATSMATLTLPPSSSVRPITTDSGIPSRTIPSTIARAVPSSCSPPMLFRFSPPRRSISSSPAK